MDDDPNTPLAARGDRRDLAIGKSLGIQQHDLTLSGGKFIHRAADPSVQLLTLSNCRRILIPPRAMRRTTIAVRIRRFEWRLASRLPQPVQHAIATDRK